MPQYSYNPWMGYNEGMQTLGNTFDTLSERRRQEQLDFENQKLRNIQMQNASLDLAEKQRRMTALEGYRGLGKTLSQPVGTTETPNPEYASLEAGMVGPPQTATNPAEALQQQAGAKEAQGLLAATPKILSTPQYLSPEQQKTSRLDYLMNQGMLDEATQYAKLMNVSESLDSQTLGRLERMNKVMNMAIMQTAKPDASGVMQPDYEAAKNYLRMIAPSLGIPAADVDKLNFSMLGGQLVAYFKSPDGTYLAMSMADPGKLVKIESKDWGPNRTGIEQTKNELRSRELDIREKNLEVARARVAQGGARIQQAWARLDPSLQGEIAQAQAVGREGGKEIVGSAKAAKDSTLSIKVLNDLEGKLDKIDFGVAGKVKGFLGRMSPTAEIALNTGDYNAFSVAAPELMKSMKELLGPQISNADAAMMLKFSGGDLMSKAATQAAIAKLKQFHEFNIEAAGAATSTVSAPGVRKNVPYTGGRMPQVGGSAGKTVVKKFTSPSTGKTKYVYSDGSEEIR